MFWKKEEGIKKEKQLLRERIAEQRKALSEEYRQQADREISMRLLLHPVFQQADSIFCYVGRRGEPDTREILETAWQLGKNVCVPRCIPGEERRMEAVPLFSWEELSPGLFDIPEPGAGRAGIVREQLSLVILPCASADPEGGRLGHGAGYYDRFLEGLSVPKFCLCYERLLSTRIPMGKLDIRMDRIITERTSYPEHRAV